MGSATVEQYATLAARAAAYAVRAHEGQYRKGTGFPYVVHPIGVAHILREYYPDREALEVAGYLHDVLEDTDTQLSYLQQTFGNEVAGLVLAVTNKGHWSLETYVTDHDVLRLKAADTLDNVLDSIRGLEKGHDVWGRFTAGERKAATWRKHADLIASNLDGEPLAMRLHVAVLRVEALRGR